MTTLTDDDLTAALGAAADTFPVPDSRPLLEELQDAVPAQPWARRRGVQLMSLAAALVVAVLLIGNLAAGSLSQTKSPATGGGVALSGGLPEAKPLPPQFNSGDAGAAGTGGSVGGGLGYASTTSVRGPAASVTSASQGTLPNAADNARVVKTGSISLVVDDGNVARTMTRLRDVAALAHGYLADEQTQIGDSPTGTVTMRVPVASFDAVIQRISSKGFGAKVVSSSSSGKDVTADYADTVAQIATLTAARGRYLTILNAAKTVGEILSVQQRIDDVQGQIDRLEGSRRVLANQSDLATLTVSVNEKKTAVLNTEPTGWSKAWKDAHEGFSRGVQSLIAHSGRALLVLLVAALALVVGRFAWRLARRRLL